MPVRYNLYEFLRCPRDRNHPLEQKQGAVRCSPCGKEYPVKDDKIIFAQYPEDAFVRDIHPPERWTRWRKSNFDYFYKELGHISKSKVLFDIGAGPTDFRELLLSFDTYIGIDFYPYKLVSVVADVTRELPFKDGSCDIIFMSNVLEHIPNPALLLRECFRILRSGGLIIGTVPFLLNVHQIPYDFNRYTNFMLEKMLNENGFSGAQVTSLGTPFDVYWTAQNNFFNLLMQSTLSENRVGHFGKKFLARFGRKIIYSTSIVFGPVFRLVSPSDIFTLGYGFKAYKRK